MNACDRFRERLEASLHQPSAADLRLCLSADPHLAVCLACASLLERDVQLHEWLALDARDAEPPANMVERLSARLESERDLAPFGALLDRLPAPVPPLGLAARIQRQVRAARRRQRMMPLGLVLAAAAALFALWLVFPLAPSAPPESDAGAQAGELPSDELLASLDLLEEWELIAGDEDDLGVWLGSLDEFDLWLLELALREGELAPATGTKTPERG